jgi:hypothetical protein
VDIEDRIELLQLPGRYGDIIDNKEWSRLGEIFTSDATFVVNSRRADTLAGIVEFMAIEPRHPLTHLMVNVYADEVDGETVLHSRAITMQPGGTMTSGRYRDLVVKTPDGWRIKARHFASTPLTRDA